MCVCVRGRVRVCVCVRVLVCTRHEQRQPVHYNKRRIHRIRCHKTRWVEGNIYITSGNGFLIVRGFESRVHLEDRDPVTIQQPILVEHSRTYARNYGDARKKPKTKKKKQLSKNLTIMPNSFDRIMYRAKLLRARIRPLYVPLKFYVLNYSPFNDIGLLNTRFYSIVYQYAN